jgi:hypothetical protein
MRTVALLFVVAAASGSAGAQARTDTTDPLKAFVFDEYPRGNDYFVNGTRDTTLIRCRADFNGDGRPDVALSEKSIWGNRTGPFEVFVSVPGGLSRYTRTADYASDLKSVCAPRLESCSSRDYLSSGTCRWRKGVPW